MCIRDSSRKGLSKATAKQYYVNSVRDFVPTFEREMNEIKQKFLGGAVQAPKDDSETRVEEMKMEEGIPVYLLDKPEDEERQKGAMAKSISRTTVPLGFSIPSDEKFDYSSYASSLQEISNRLFSCLEEERLDVVREMIESGVVDVNKIQDKNGSGVLHFVIDKEKMEAVDYLLSLPNIDVEMKDSDGVTPLHVAVLLENEEIIRKLIQKGANHQAIAPIGESPYSEASAAIRLVIEDELAKCGRTV
eukprot:TRINITY_DN2800_c0_g1_i4.p1 TRINITY_DN2800_c0_g1~~TRINITY_DN2800_c0_g1_i4.p1  ORF type:complete len:266 (-),score=92.39 TRINITY_DN2800_c0_g1_i4:15-755(-)